jgi:hypothetical protein
MQAKQTQPTIPIKQPAPINQSAIANQINKNPNIKPSQKPNHISEKRHQRTPSQPIQLSKNAKNKTTGQCFPSRRAADKTHHENPNLGNHSGWSEHLCP